MDRCSRRARLWARLSVWSKSQMTMPEVRAMLADSLKALENVQGQEDLKDRLQKAIDHIDSEFVVVYYP